MKSTSNVWNDFLNSSYAQKEINKMEKKAQYEEQRPAGSGQTYPQTQLNPTVETQGVNAGGASMVGNEDRGPLYTTSPAPVPGGQEQYADAKVEGLEDVAKAMLDVAMKAPTGGPLGTQDNMAEKWDGIAAAGGNVQQFTKTSNEEAAKDFMKGFSGTPMMEDSSETELNQILNELEAEEEGFTAEASKKKETLATLKELYKVANDLDQLGQYDDANAIDDVLREQVKELVASKKK